MKVGIIHTRYEQEGGEDVMVSLETFYLQQNGVSVSTLFFSNKGSVRKKILNFILSPLNFISCRKVSKWLEAERPDVVHIHNWHFAASPAIIWVIKRKGIPIVHTLHNFRLLCPSATLLHNNKIFLHSLKNNFPWKAIYNKVYNHSILQTFYLSFTVWLHKILGTWKKVDRFIVLSDHAKNTFLSSNFPFNNNQLVVKPNFISNYKPAITKREDYFVFVGRLSDEKGIHTLLQAFSSVPYNLLIIGDGPLKSLVINRTQTHSNITYLGFKKRPEILALLSTCTALIFPSIWYEGFPLTIIEAFACGTPVIASKMGAMETIIVDHFNGMHFESGECESLIQAIKYWNDLQEADKEIFRKNARQTYKQLYTPEKNMDQLKNIYNAVISESKQNLHSFSILSKQTV